MSAVILGPELREKLNGLNEELEFRDETGELLGHFVPPDRYRTLLYAWVESTCPYSPEDLERMRNEKGGRTLSEIWQSLGVQ